MGVLSQGSRLRRVWSWIFIIASVSVRVAVCRECSESEFRDSQGVCTECMKCAPGTELSQECGRGLGGQASCMPCPSRRYKEAWGPQRCLLCLDCALLNRAHAHNCTHTHNAVCGECVQGFYRKTRLGGFQDSECVSCASSPPADRTQCGQRVSVVRVSHGDTLSDERAVTGVVCGVLATVLVAVSAFCLVYWKHHLAHKLAHHQQQQQQQQRDGAVEAQEEEPDDDAGREEEEEDVARALAPGEGTLGEGTPPGKKGTPPGKKGTPPGRSGDPHGEELVPLKPPHTALAVCDGPSSLRSLQPDFTAAAPCAHCCLHHGGPDPNHNPYLLGRAVAAGNRASRGRPRGGGGEDPVRCGCCEDPARGEGVGGDWGVRGAAGGGARWRLATEHSEPPATGCDLPTGPCDDSLHKGHVTPPGMLGRGAAAAAAPLLCSQHAPLPVCHCEGCPMGRLAVGVRGRAPANQEIRVDL